ncbi:MAG: hypothetical protein NC548_21200 [Lachnospiraceae bacterium]|nr:hypothetical protein [Lachnospiraceae bacterium]
MFFSKLKIKATEIMEQAVNFLHNKYDQAAHVFTPASPFGQLLIVIANISELIFTYIAHVAEELNIQTAQNIETIHGLSRLTGHDPYRGASAYGMMGVKLNTSTDLIDGNYLVINNFTRFTIHETGQNYFINMPCNYVKLMVGSSDYVNLHFIQGEVESQTFTSNGKPLQSFNPTMRGMTDNDNVAVTVNGKQWNKVESLYDMPADDGIDSGECFMVKSSVNIGLTVIFGNGNFGKIPPEGATIVITYIKTAGAAGNAYTSSLNYTFTDTGTDENGSSVDLNEVLQIETIAPPLLGADYEDPEFTKMIAPRTSKSFVLATPENYVSFLSKYNQYSYIYAYNTKDDTNLTDNNVIYLKILPNIKRKLSSSQDYFELPTSEFLLDNFEKQSIIDAIVGSGRMLVSSDIRLIEPTISRFVINIIVRYFEANDKNAIRIDIRQKLNTYFLNINRNDIVPLSDIIAIVENTEGVDTCDVFFVSEKNEQAILNRGYYKMTTSIYNYQAMTSKTWVDVMGNEDPRLGFDDFGNIIVGEDEICIPKGGWTDRDGNYYYENPTMGQLGPLNIFFLDKVEYSSYNQNMQRKLTKLLNNN